MVMKNTLEKRANKLLKSEAFLDWVNREYHGDGGFILKQILANFIIARKEKRVLLKNQLPPVRYQEELAKILSDAGYSFSCINRQASTYELCKINEGEYMTELEQESMETWLNKDTLQ